MPDSGTVPSRSTVSVVVPTWRRARDLGNCLEALSKQGVPPLEIVVVWRQGDDGVHEVLDRWAPRLPLRSVEVDRPGVVAAMNRGLDEVVGEIVALTDDDGAPHPDWIRRIGSIYRDQPDVVAFGGRDLVHEQGGILPATSHRVGELSWFGRASGNHHAGLGGARDVRFLKGVNCSFRRNALQGLRFEEKLRGKGAQSHWELAFFLELGRRGRIVYDPTLLVDHYPAIRFDVDQRETFHPEAMSDAAYNETIVLLRQVRPVFLPVFVAWAFLIGHTASPGLLQAFRHSIFGSRPKIWRTLFASWRGRWDAILSR